MSMRGIWKIHNAMNTQQARSEYADICPFVEQPGLDRTELAIVALITYAAGAITGGRLREELREAFVRKPEEWQGMLDLALGLSLIESQGK